HAVTPGRAGAAPSPCSVGVDSLRLHLSGGAAKTPPRHGGASSPSVRRETARKASSLQQPPYFRPATVVCLPFQAITAAEEGVGTAGTMLTPARSRKRHAANSGLPVGTSGGTSRSGRRRTRKRGRARTSSKVDMDGLPDVSAKLAAEEFREQQREAKEYRDRTRAEELANHAQEREERGIRSSRRKSGGQL
ncbi:unnamed protein product, partial [Pylaiella littoralis]